MQMMRGHNGSKRCSSTRATCCEDDHEDVDDDDCIRFELNSLIAEVDQVMDSELFRYLRWIKSWI
jgi:hypothetical protein